MLAAIKGYYNGKQIVMNEDVKLAAGQKVIVTILEMQNKAKKKIDLKNIWAEAKRCFKQMHKTI